MSAHVCRRHLANWADSGQLVALMLDMLWKHDMLHAYNAPRLVDTQDADKLAWLPHCWLTVNLVTFRHVSAHQPHTVMDFVALTPMSCLWGFGGLLQGVCGVTAV